MQTERTDWLLIGSFGWATLGNHSMPNGLLFVNDNVSDLAESEF